MSRPPILALLLSSLVLASSCRNLGETPAPVAEAGETPSPSLAPQPSALPQPTRELRGLWVASFMGIDWPKTPSTDPSVLRAGMGEILDEAAAAGLNSIFLQVRPCGDALYPSAQAPWSSWLTGAQGLAPEGGFDPLAAWIEECRLRGLRLHAWINPFRVGAPSIKDYADSSILKTHPELVRNLGDPGYLWLDPGRKESRMLVIEAVREIIENYPVDGIVLDDYFYPYKEQYPTLQAFPDQESFRLASSPASEGQKSSPSLEEWRRANIDAMVRDLGSAIHGAAPDLPFGVSPFGIWRPDRERGIQGKDAWAELYEDSRKWLSEGSLDYLCPQLYWPISRPGQSFPILLERWNAWNDKERLLAPALRVAQPGFSPEEQDRELSGQILVERAMRRSGGGVVLFSARSLSLAKSLPALYAKPALPPEMPWLGGEPLPPPQASLSPREEGGFELSWEALGAREVLLRTRGPSSSWELRILPAGASPLSLEGRVTGIVLSAVDRAGREGERFTISTDQAP